MFKASCFKGDYPYLLTAPMYHGQLGKFFLFNVSESRGEEERERRRESEGNGEQCWGMDAIGCFQNMSASFGTKYWKIDT